MPDPSDADLLLLSSGTPMSTQDILNMLPQQHVADRLVHRYYTAATPVQGESSKDSGPRLSLLWL